MPSFSLFNYNRAGFNQTPTDYYLRPVSLLIDQHLSHKFCYQDRLTIEFYYSWILSQMEALRIRGQPFLTISHLADLTHNEHLNAGIADRPLFTMLSEIFRRKLNYNTVIVVFSDHGIRFGRLRQTRSGFDEERLSFLYLYVPDNGDFFMNPKRARQIMSLNSHRLTSHFDIHATLRHILDHTPPIDEPYGRSLLTPIPINRTCSEGGINPEWCLCTEYRPIPSNEPTARCLARFVVWKINRLLSSFRNKCSILRLSQVVLVKIETRSADSHNPKKSKLIQRFLVQLKTRPGNALLEATVKRLPRQTVPSINKHRKRRLSIVGDISRLNRYSPQASCIHNSVLEKYCHCNKRSSTV